MNKKGFTLFTALVSFVLILLTAMIVQTMIKAERDRTEVMSNIEEQAEMQAMADLTRAEALQTFNYSLRKKIEEYFDYSTGSGNRIQVLAQDYNFDELKDNFAQFHFGVGTTSNGTGNAVFANEMKNAMIGTLPSKKYIGPYEISLKFKGESTSEQRETVTDAFEKALAVSVQKGNFFEVVNCENGDPENCVGTFYLNLRIGELDDKTYESFPQIKIKNSRTQRILQESIFPKGDIKIYIPIRLFKAMAEARALALEFGEEKGNLWKTNYGLFSPRIHNEIEEMKLGICDSGYCSVRTNPYVHPEFENMDGIGCPNTQNNIGASLATFTEIIPVYCTQDLKNRGICSNVGATIFYYNPSRQADSASQSNRLAMLAELRLCYLAGENYNTGNYLDPIVDGLNLINNTSSGLPCDLGGGKSISFSISATPRNSVKIESPGISGNVSLGSSTLTAYNANYPYSESGSNCPQISSAGTILMGNFGVGIEEINGTEKIVQKTTDDPCVFNGSNMSFGSGLTTQYATCSEVTRVAVNLSFQETNQNYIVNKTREPVYVIELVDNKFTPDKEELNFHQKEDYKIDTTTCGFEENSQSNSNECVDSEWICESIPATASGGPSTFTGGCKVK